MKDKEKNDFLSSLFVISVSFFLSLFFITKKKLIVLDGNPKMVVFFSLLFFSYYNREISYHAFILSNVKQ